MGFNKLLNLKKPTEPHEATTKEYVDVYFYETKENVENYKKETKKEVEEFIDTTKQDIEQFKELTREVLKINEAIIQTRLLQFKKVIVVSPEFRNRMDLKRNQYFTFFIHSTKSKEIFTMPLEGRILKIKLHINRYRIDFLEGGNLNSTPINYDIENKILEFSLKINDRDYLLFNPTQKPTTLANPILLQPDDEISLSPISDEPIRINAFVVLVIELNV